MRTLYFIILTSIIVSCSDTKDNISDFSYIGNFYPSFIPKCKVTIVKNDTASYIKLTVWDYPQIEESINDTVLREIHFDPKSHEIPKITLLEDSIFFSDNDLQLFFKTLDTLSILNFHPNETGGLDGITVDNDIRINNKKTHYRFWSPRKTDKEHKLVEAVLTTCRHKFSELKYQEYFESLEQYFDFGLPCKIITTYPLEIRIYGILSINEEKELIPFINAIPSDKKLIIDMTNFEGMGTMYYPNFKALDNRNKKILWVVKDKTLLHEIGIDTSLVLTDIKIARQRLN